MMKKMLFISLTITACHITLHSMDPDEGINTFGKEQADFYKIIIRKKQIYTPIAPIRKFAPLLADLIENKQDYPQKKLVKHLSTMIHIINAADAILQPNPDSQEGSYKNLQLKILAHTIGKTEALNLMLLGQTIDVDQRIIDALSLQVAHSSSSNVGKILRYLEQKNPKLRKDIIRQYFLHNGTLPEGTDPKKDNPKFTINDILIHARQVNTTERFRSFGA